MHLPHIKAMNSLLNEVYAKGNTQHVITFPQSMVLSVSSRCNYQCVMCNVWHREPEDISEKVLAEVRGVLPFLEKIHITGGEPLLYGNLWELLDECRKNMVNISIVTNGSLLTDSKIEKILDYGVRNIKFSLDAATQETYSKIRHANFYHVAKNIAKLSRAKAERKTPYPLIEFGFVAMQNNIHELSKCVVLAHELGANSVRAAHVFPAALDDPKSMCLKYDQERSDREMTKAMRIAEHFGVTLEIPKLFAPHPEQAQAQPGQSRSKERQRSTCNDPWRFVWITPTGDIRLCCLGGSGFYGNLNEADFPTLWNLPARMEVRRLINTDTPPSACAGCTVLPKEKRGKKKRERETAEAV
ncbi:MAG: radical SAM/SPASM domain-containing protein [Desulfovibrionaceae bacterium]